MSIKQLLTVAGAFALTACAIGPAEPCMIRDDTNDYTCILAPTGEEVTVDPATGREP